MRRLMVPFVIVFSCLAVLLIYFGMKAQSYEELKYNEAIAFVWKVKQHNSEVYEHFFKVRSGIDQNYDGLSEAVARLLNDARVLAGKKEGLLKPDSLQFTDKAENFLSAAEKRAEMVGRFKVKHAIFKSSLAYFYLNSEVMGEKYDNNAIKSKIAEVARKVLLYVTTEGSMAQQDLKLEILSAARTSIKEAVRMIQDESGGAHFHQFISHANSVLSSSAAMNTIISASNAIPIEYFIEDILVEYQKYNKSLKQGRKKYQSIMLTASICFILLFIYFMFIMSRNAVVLFREKARSKTALSSIHDGVIVTNERGLIEYINPAAEKLTEYKNEKVVGQPIENVFSLLNEKTHQQVENSVRSCLRKSEVVSEGKHTVLVTSTNESVAIKHSVAPILDQNRHLTGAVLVFEDVTISRRMARELEWAATHDPLTGLVNRREFSNRTVEALITAQLDQQNHALLYMDLDKFKVVNDTGGHAAGDALLLQVVDCIRNVLRSSDIFARIGGDEFAVLLTYCPLVNSIQVANKILTAIKDLSFEWDRQIFNIGISIGVTEIDQYSKSDSSVMSLADDACYMAKSDGRNCVRVIELKKGVMHRRRTGEEVLKAGL